MSPAQRLLLMISALAACVASRRRLTETAAALLLTLLLGAPGLLTIAALAFFAPLSTKLAAVLRRQAAQDAVRGAVPALLTDLTMAAEAGQPLHAALRYARLYRTGPVAVALQRYLDEHTAGRSISEALDVMRQGLATSETDRLMALLQRDAQLGLPLGASVARYRQAWLGAMRREAARTGAYMPYVFTALAGLLLLEGVALLAIPWFATLWRGF